MPNSTIAAVLSLPALILSTPASRIPCEPRLLPVAAAPVQVKSSLPVEGEYLPVELTCSVRGSAGKVVLTHMNYRGFTRRLRIDFERTLVRHVRLEQGHINEGEYVKLKEVTVTDQLNSEDRDFVTKMTTAVKNEVGNACGANQAKRAAYRETLKKNITALKEENLARLNR